MRWCRVIAGLASGCLTAFVSSNALAQASATEQAAYMAGLRLDRSMLVGPLVPGPRSAMRVEGSGELQEVREVSLIGSGVVLEMGRLGPDGKFVRPRLLIGRQSPELRSWMAAAGITAERCMLPQFRGRVKRDPETGKLGAAVMVSARCTFY